MKRQMQQLIINKTSMLLYSLYAALYPDAKETGHPTINNLIPPDLTGAKSGSKKTDKVQGKRII